MAGINTPFSAELVAVFTGTDREAGLLDAEGQAKLMGAVTGVIRHETRGKRELGVFFIENAAGDRLSFSYEIATKTGEGSFEVEEGAGRFFGATGGGDLTVHAPLSDGSYPVTFEGTISFGELPFSVGLIAVSAGKHKEAFLFAVEGDATHMGPVTGIVRDEVRGPREFGFCTLEGASGDMLVFTYEFRFDPVLAVGTFTIVSGTGRYEDAVGAGMIFVDETHLPGEPFPVEIEGTISF
jgi:hypothetical protein